MYTPQEKTRLIDKLKDLTYFEKDLELFHSKFKRHMLIRELARVNNVNRERLCAQMIYFLLDAATEEEIVANRTGQAPTKGNDTDLGNETKIADENNVAPQTPQPLEADKPKSLKKKALQSRRVPKNRVAQQQ